MPSNRRILLADDDPNDVELMIRAFKRVGLEGQVDVVNDGEQALDYLFRRGAYGDRPAGVPAVVVLDIKMPRVGGLQVLEHMRNDDGLRQVPVVMLSSSSEPRDIETSYSLGTNAYVVKPTNFQQFSNAVERIGAFWANTNQPPAA